MARPRTDRTERIYIRLTESEKEAIEGKASQIGLTGADWLRRIGLERKLPAGKLDAESKRLMMTQLLGMARNLNQLTALAHRSHMDPNGIEAMRVELQTILDKVTRL